MSVFTPFRRVVPGFGSVGGYGLDVTWVFEGWDVWTPRVRCFLRGMDWEQVVNSGSNCFFKCFTRTTFSVQFVGTLPEPFKS